MQEKQVNVKTMCDMTESELQELLDGLKKTDTKILAGYQIYHNYVRPHEGLKGKTPAEARGITVEGRDKWLTIIQNASQ